MLVQILIVYFGIPQALRPLGFSWLRYGGVFSAGVDVLAINAGAYMSEIVRAGIEASRSLGLNYFQTMMLYCFMALFYLVICLGLSKVALILGE